MIAMTTKSSMSVKARFWRGNGWTESWNSPKGKRFRICLTSCDDKTVGEIWSPNPLMALGSEMLVEVSSFIPTVRAAWTTQRDGPMNGTNGFNARPHPGLLPRREGESFAVFLECRAAEMAGASRSNRRRTSGFSTAFGPAPTGRNLFRYDRTPIQSSVRSGIGIDAAPTEFGNLFRRMNYKDAAPMALRVNGRNESGVTGESRPTLRR